MDEQTFNELSTGKIGGVFSVLSGRMSIDGSKSLVRKFDREVIRKYNPHIKYPRM